MPGRYCFIKGCKSTFRNKKLEKTKFFSFPKNSEVRELWLEACGDKNLRNVRAKTICSRHFAENDWRLQDILLNIPIERRQLKPTAVPSIMMPEKPKQQSAIARENRITKWNIKKTVKSAIKEYDLSTSKKQNIPEVNIVEEGKPTFKTIAIQTETEINCSREIKIIELEKIIKSLKTENADLYRKYEEEHRQNENMESSLKKIYTTGRIEKIKNPEKQIG